MASILVWDQNCRHTEQSFTLGAVQAPKICKFGPKIYREMHIIIVSGTVARTDFFLSFDKVKFGKLRQTKCPSVYSLFSSPLWNFNSTPVTLSSEALHTVLEVVGSWIFTEIILRFLWFFKITWTSLCSPLIYRLFDIWL